jgi:hypothetical protein
VRFSGVLQISLHGFSLVKGEDGGVIFLPASCLFSYAFLVGCPFFVKDFKDQIKTKSSKTVITQKKAEPGRTLP